MIICTQEWVKVGIAFAPTIISLIPNTEAEQGPHRTMQQLLLMTTTTDTSRLTILQ